MGFKDTIGSVEWLGANEDNIKELLPSTWTHVDNLNVLQIGFGLKCIGIDWRNEEDFGRVMVFLESMGFLLRDGITVKRNPHKVVKGG